MDDEYYKSVIKVFIDLYKKGLIYRGKRMVNWDPASLTALSDEEVIFKDVDSKLYYVTYKFADDSHGKGITVATTRPETILGDVAICVNPLDERYSKYVGKEVIVPIINRKIPIIADEYVTADFGTGALKVTPAHDKNDNMLGLKHGLKALDTLDVNGKFTTVELMEDQPSELVMSYNGVDRFELRNRIARDIAALGQIEKIEDYKGQVGTSERTGAVIESKLSMQWFIDMQKFLERNPRTLKDVMNDTIQFHPAKLKNTYSHWLTNIKDWCISRQLWWGQRIPAWYLPDGKYLVAATKEEAWQQCIGEKLNVKSKTGDSFEVSRFTFEDLKQDDDVLDTWFSSWLWPMEVFKGISHPGNDDIKYYYPTNTLVTAPEIIFFWVARMIMAGEEYMGQKPFSDVYFTGIVRDKLGRKMSKSLGNSPDLLALIDTFGADAVRFGILVSSPAGNDLMFDESALEQGRNFNNKMWNALKLLKKWEGRQAASHDQKATGNFAFDWFENRLNEASAEIDSLMKQFRLSEALKTLYSLIWDDFCSWYLEWVKPGYEQPIDAAVYTKTVEFFPALMQLLHPFMPFVTEEIYHQLADRSDDICVKQNQPIATPDTGLLRRAQVLKQVITALREARAKNQLKPKDPISLYVETSMPEVYTDITDILLKQVNASEFNIMNEPVAGTILVAVEKDKFMIASSQILDTTGLKTTLLKDLEHQQGFLDTVMKKLGNERFVQNAKPEVVAIEKTKQADALARIKAIEESLAQLG
ncbi:valine--tRNA ligase [soil metagenome]